MKKYVNIDIIKEAIYSLCVRANTLYSQELYDKLLSEYETCVDVSKQQSLHNILANINMAESMNRPLCQDTGQVLVFIEIGNNVNIDGDIKEAVNESVAKAYKENFFRKSVVNNALFNRENTQTNTPAIIYTDYIAGDEINIKVLIKGAGSENYSVVKMFNPTVDKVEIFEFVSDSLLRAGEKACPPYVIGLGVGGTMDYAAVMSKKAFFNTSLSSDEEDFVQNLKKYLENNSVRNVLDIKIQTSATHIACLPVAITINCHSARHSECTIKNNDIFYKQISLKTSTLKACSVQREEVNVCDIAKIRALKPGQQILLTGDIYTARDAAHSKLLEYYQLNGSLPIELKNKIIFYAGPCPPAPNEPIGPIGPTTSARMDKFTEFIYGNGVIATIGKGERSLETAKKIEQIGGKYFTAQGGIACLLSKCVVASEVVAFEELGTEAIRKLSVEKLPVSVQI